MVNYCSRSSIQGRGYQLGMLTRFFLLSLLPSPKAAAWGWPSAVPLWSRTVADCGQAPTVERAQLFISPYRSRLRSQHWSSKDAFSDFHHETGYDTSVGGSAIVSALRVIAVAYVKRGSSIRSEQAPYSICAYRMANARCRRGLSRPVHSDC